MCEKERNTHKCGHFLGLLKATDLCETDPSQLTLKVTSQCLSSALTK